MVFLRSGVRLQQSMSTSAALTATANASEGSQHIAQLQPYRVPKQKKKAVTEKSEEKRTLSADLDDKLCVSPTNSSKQQQLTSSTSATSISDSHTAATHQHHASTDEQKQAEPQQQTLTAAELELYHEEERYTRFLRWLTTHGAKFPYLQLQRYSADYRGVHVQLPASLQYVPRGKVLLRIPHQLLITVELVKSTPLGSAVSSISSTGSQALLAVYLLQERNKGSDSFWSPWLTVLPSNFHTLPMYFNRETLDLLKGCNDLLTKIQHHQKVMRDEYDCISGLPQVQALKMTYSDFCWGCHAVGTRVFSLMIHGVKTSVLSPLADMMNHRNPSGTNWTYDTERDAFTLTSTSVMYDGDQIYESYGLKCNKRFFVSYGFVLDDNRENEVTLQLRAVLPQIQKSAFTVHAAYDVLAEEVFCQLRSHYVSTASHTLLSPQSAMQSLGSPLPQSSLYQQSAISQSNTPRNAANTGSNAPPQYRSAVSIHNEVNVLDTIIRVCEHQLRQYDTTYHEDTLLLQQLASADDNIDTVNTKNCITYRRGEKRIYHYWIEFCTVVKHLLSGESEYEQLYELLQVLCKAEQPPTPAEEQDDEEDNTNVITIDQLLDSIIPDRIHTTFTTMSNYLTDIIHPLLQSHYRTAIQQQRELELQRLKAELDQMQQQLSEDEATEADIDTHYSARSLHILNTFTFDTTSTERESYTSSELDYDCGTSAAAATAHTDHSDLSIQSPFSAPTPVMRHVPDPLSPAHSRSITSPLTLPKMVKQLQAQSHTATTDNTSAPPSNNSTTSKIPTINRPREHRFPAIAAPLPLPAAAHSSSPGMRQYHAAMRGQQTRPLNAVKYSSSAHTLPTSTTASLIGSSASVSAKVGRSILQMEKKHHHVASLTPLPLPDDKAA